MASLWMQIRPEVWLCAAALTLCMLVAAGSVPVMVLAARAKARRERRGAYDLCARQLTRLGLWCGAWMGGVGIALVWNGMEESDPLFRLAGSAGVIVCVLSLGLRLAARNRAAGWLALGMTLAAWVALLGGLAACLAFSGPEAAASPLPARLAFVLAQIMAAPGVAGLGLGILIAWSLASAGGLSLLLLLVRRGADDYGRDYYVLAARWCARWAVWGGVGATALGVLTGGLELSAGGPWHGPTLAAGAAVLASLAWMAVALSHGPMRLKVLMIAGFVLLVACIAAAIAACLAV